MRIYFIIISIFLLNVLHAQEKVENDSIAIDSLFREDQFYFNFTYNNLLKTTNSFSQEQFSPSFSIGFLRDMPINKKRTWAIATGLGYAYSRYNTNLLINKEITQEYTFQIVPDGASYSKNKLLLHHLEIPLEIRWRNATPQSHQFWRIYTGFKLQYLIKNSYKYQGDPEDISLKNIPNINKINYGATVSAGWNTWNIYVYYGLNELFSNANIEDEPIDMKTINIGLQFYIL